MAATHLPLKPKLPSLESIRLDNTGIDFVAADLFVWVPTKRTIHFPKQAVKDSEFFYSLLHEIGHAKLEHKDFGSDIELIRLERAAWDMAVVEASRYGYSIPEAHIESCLDTYRDWLYRRSMCPNCEQCGLQTSKMAYKCIFCSSTWAVSKSRLCKVTRRSIKKGS